MADEDDVPSDPMAKAREHNANAAKALKDAGEHLDNASDMLDHIESKMSTVTGGNPMPQRRPIAAGPDAAGNNRSTKSPLYDYKKD